jgi:hypothetical protein
VLVRLQVPIFAREQIAALARLAVLHEREDMRKLVVNLQRVTQGGVVGVRARAQPSPDPGCEEQQPEAGEQHR